MTHATTPEISPAAIEPELVRRYVEDGYVVVPDLVAEDELAELKTDAVTLARGGYPSETLKPLPADMPAEEILRSILCIHNPHYVSPVMRRYVRHPRIGALLGALTGAHLPYWDGSVKCMQSMLFVKPPGFQGQAWHQDEIFIPTRDRSLVGAWIALDDATVENGCLWVVPGSHRMGYLYPLREHDDLDEFDPSPESYGFDDSGEVPLECRAGSVAFFNGYLLHRSKKNRSSGYRRSLVNHYMNAWSLLPWIDEPDSGLPAFAQADVRTVVHAAGVDPYAWKGYENPPSDVWLRTCKANEPDG